MHESGRQPLTDVQRQRIGERFDAGEEHLKREFENGGGFSATALPDHIGVQPEIPEESMDGDVAVMTAQAIQAAVDYATYGPGYWLNTPSKCVWVSLLDEHGESITPPSATTISDAYWGWNEDAGETTEMSADQPLLLTVSSNGISLAVIYANGEELAAVSIKEAHELLLSLVAGRPVLPEDPEEYHIRDGGSSDEVVIGRGRQDHAGHLEIIVPLHSLAAILAGWVLMHPE